MTDYSVIGKRVPGPTQGRRCWAGRNTRPTTRCPTCSGARWLGRPFPTRASSMSIRAGGEASGVKAVITGKDFGGWTWGFMATTRDPASVAVDKVRYLHEAVAAVAATDEDIAEEACELIKVDYEELPAVFDAEEAMKEGAPVIHDYRPNNVSVEYHWSFGDVEKAFAESYLVREDRFETGGSSRAFSNLPPHSPTTTLPATSPSGRQNKAPISITATWQAASSCPSARSG